MSNAETSFFFSLSTSDAIALLGVGIGLLSTIVLIGVSYHIARAQGWLRHHKLLATFGVHDYKDPSFVIFNINNLPGRLNVAPIWFFILNQGKFALSNVSVQFNIYPRNDLSSLGEPIPGAHMYAIGGHDIFEYRLGSLAPEEGTMIGVPYLLDPSRLTQTPHRLGYISAYVTHDNGRRIVKRIEVGGMFEENFIQRFNDKNITLRGAVSNLIESFIRREGDHKIRAAKAFICAIFNLPFARRMWIAYDAKFVSENERLGLERTIAFGMEPELADGETELYVTGSTRIKLVVQFFALCIITAILILAYLKRTILLGYIGQL
jgi:hypothetical protein